MNQSLNRNASSPQQELAAIHGVNLIRHLFQTFHFCVLTDNELLLLLIFPLTSRTFLDSKNV